MTSEPVGNRPRSDAGNSHKAREAREAQAQQKAAPVPQEEREPVEKVVTGKVITRKTPWYRKMVNSMVAEDASSVGDFLMTDVVIPALKNLIRDVGVGALDRTLYGSSRARANRQTIIGSVGGIKAKYHDIPQERPRSLTQQQRAVHDFGEIVLTSHAEAEDVIVRMMNRINLYGTATVADLYNFLGVSGSFQDLSWGWTSLDGADVRQVRSGFVLELPAPQSLRP